MSGACPGRALRPGHLQGAVKVREVIRLIERDGWHQVAQRGSHRHFKHASKPGKVTIPGKRSDDLHPELEWSILKQAGLR